MKNLRYLLIIRYLQNELKEEEKSKFEQWRSASSENEKHFQEVKFIWQQSKSAAAFESEVSVDIDAALANVHRQLPQTAKVVNFNRRRLLRISAAAAVAFLVSLFFLFPSSTPDLIVVTTSDSEQKQVTLPDESIVWLNENSQLTYPESFEKKTREVRMIGDLVFEVTPNKQKPFIVKSQELAVEVLGTKFNVSSPKLNNTNAFVHVLHGKVKVQRDDLSGNPVILGAGMSAVLDKKNALSLTEDFSVNRLFWLNKELQFDHSSLKEVFADLEYIFKVKLEIENPKMLECEFSGKFDDSISIEKLLDMMTVIFDAEIEKINSTHFKIKKGTC